MKLDSSLSGWEYSVTLNASEALCKVCSGCLCTNTCACGPWPHLRFSKRSCRAMTCSCSPASPFDLHSGEERRTCGLQDGSQVASAPVGDHSLKFAQQKSSTALWPTPVLTPKPVLWLCPASCVCWHLGICCRVREQCCCRLPCELTHSEGQTKSPVPGTQRQSWMVIFSLFSICCKFPLAIEVFAFWAFQSHYSGN